MLLFVKLLLSHLLGDFLLQPHSWVADKEKRGYKSPFLYLHCLLHGLLAWLLVAQWWFAPYALLLTAGHFCIDLSKWFFATPASKRRWFFTDQALHLLLLGLIAMRIDGPLYFNAPSGAFWIVFTGVVFLTQPASIVIRRAISGWTPQNNDDSLANAGNFIGILERLFIFGFVLSGHFEAVGFLLAAKSIFRFGDLTGAKDRQLTEYVLIGTLLSFGLALLTASFVKMAC